VKLKVVATLCALAMGSVGTAFADSSLNQQVSDLQAQVQKLQAQVNSIGNNASTGSSSAMVGFYSPLTWQLLDNYTGVGTEMSILKARQANNIANQAIYLGGAAKADALYQHSNTAGSFTTLTSSTENASGLRLSQAAVDVIGNINTWTTAYAQLGATNIGASGSNDTVSFQKAYLLLGNLSQSPVYATVGKKDIDFGNFTTVNMYTNPLNRSVFQASGNQLAVGYAQYGFNGTVSVMNGGTDGNGTNLYTTNSGQINNFAVNAGYAGTNNGVNWGVGAGYLNGANQYAESATALNSSTAAWDINGTVGVNNFNVLAEYTADVNDVAPGYGRTQAWDLGANYLFPVMGRNSVVSADYSAAKIANTTFDQYVVGFRNEVISNVWAGVEYAYNDGVVTTNANGTVTSSNANARNNTITLDLTAMF
jgi:hypothetical protein